ncbi:PH domain-containing protein [Nonomuraea sp. NPDC046570]|uniref:PH domain-containing protein n=1 Tax=Nonomuraea sp. NPDC046570 TaxID=3155255 RepID=UPI0033DCEE27
MSDETGWRTLHRRVPLGEAVMSLAVVVPAVTGLTRFMLGEDFSPALTAAAGAGATALIIGAALCHGMIRLRSTRFRLTGERLELVSGTMVREHRSIPRDRVRSVDLKADPVRRALGLAVLKVGTGEHASGGKAELTLDAIAVREAEALRRTLLNQPAREEPEEPLARLRWAWIRYAPLTVWTFVGGALVVGVASRALKALGVEVFETRAAAQAWDWFTGALWLTIPLLVLANVLVGLAGAAAVYAQTWGRYRLEQEPGTLRIRRGLLTTRSLTLRESRLRGVQVAEPLLLRFGGGARVKVVAGGLRKDKDDESEDKAALTPPLPAAEAHRIAAAILREHALPLGDLRPHPRAARTRRLRSAALTVAVLAAALGATGALTAWIPGWAYAVPVAVLPVALWFAADGARGLGHLLGERHLVTRSGSAVRRTVALDRSGIVGWTITESYFQRRLGLLTVSATTGAGDGHYDVLDVGRADGLDLAARAVPGLLGPFLVGAAEAVPARASGDRIPQRSPN